MSSYADSLLTTNEHVVYRTRKHWVAPIIIALPASLILLGGVVSLLTHLMIGDIPLLRQLTLWGGWGAVLVGAAWLANSFVRWYSMEYVVTNQKVIKAWGILRKHSDSASLEKINEISMEQGLLGRLMNYGTLQVRTASDSADLRYWAMESPQEYRKQILEAKHAYERSDAEFIAGAFAHSQSPAAAAPADSSPQSTGPQSTGQQSTGQQSTAELPTVAGFSAPREADLTSTSVPAASSAPAAVASIPDDIPTLLAKLGALRDSGVLSAAEFEAKKAELLGRL